MVTTTIRRRLARNQTMSPEALAARWVEQAEAISRAEDPDAANAGRDRELAAVLDDRKADELMLIEALIAAVGSTYTRQHLRRALKRRLASGPVAPINEQAEAALLELAVRETDLILDVRHLRRVAGRTYPVEVMLPLNVSERARDIRRLMGLYRKRRAEYAARQAAEDEGREKSTAALEALKARLEQSGDWALLLKGSLVADAWLESEHFARLAAEVNRDWSLSADIPRRLLRELVAKEAGR